MADIKEYDSKVLLIKSIKNEDILIPTNIPIEVYIQEAETLYHWSISDKEKLVSKGLPEDLIEDLPIRSAILREAESKWQLEKYGQEDLQKQWSEQSSIAYKLRDELIHHFKFAFRKDNELLKRVSAIKGGSGHADMFQDLSDLSVLGKEYGEKLKLIGFDFTLLDKANEMTKNLPTIFGKIKSKKGNTTDIKKFRDQCYTYLKQVVDEIREHGQYLFWKDEDRKKGYYSQHTKKKNVKKSVKKDKVVEEEKTN